MGTGSGARREAGPLECRPLGAPRRGATQGRPRAARPPTSRPRSVAPKKSRARHGDRARSPSGARRSLPIPLPPPLIGPARLPLSSSQPARSIPLPAIAPGAHLVLVPQDGVGVWLLELFRQLGHAVLCAHRRGRRRGRRRGSHRARALTPRGLRRRRLGGGRGRLGLCRGLGSPGRRFDRLRRRGLLRDRRAHAPSRRRGAIAKRSSCAGPCERVAPRTVAVEGRLWRQPMGPAATLDGELCDSVSIGTRGHAGKTRPRDPRRRR